VSFLTYPVVVLIQYFLFGTIKTEYLDGSMRFLLTPFIFILLSKIPYHLLRPFFYAAALGALITSFIIVWQFNPGQVQIPIIGSETKIGLAPSTYFIIVMGIFSLPLLALNSTLRFLAILIIFAVCIASYYTYERAGWLTILSLVVIYILYHYKLTWRGILWIIFSVSLFSSVLMSTPLIQDKIKVGFHEMKSPLTEVSDTSIGIRRQFWIASFTMFQKEPLWGMGRGKFKKHLPEIIEEKKLNPVLLNFSHPHNDFLYALSELGIFGGVGFIALLLSPAIFFYRYRQNRSSEIKMISQVGLAVILSYFIFGLFDCVIAASPFKTSRYLLSVVIPMAMISSIKNKISKK
jgi:O-antigen ligase